jgi:pimeloyl-ACP methyl ester carboxylesterase
VDRVAVHEQQNLEEQRRRKGLKMLVDIGTGTRLDVHQLGDGSAESLLMVGATAQPWQLWEPLAQAFSRRFRVVGYDHRGIGASERGEGAITVASLADDAMGVLDALEIERAHLLGWSLGSAVCQEAAIARPERVASLVLWGTWATTDAYQRALFTALRHPWATGDLAAALTVLALVFSPEFVNAPEMQARMAALLPAFPHNEVGMRAVAEQWDADLAHDSATRLAAISAPTLVVSGEHDLLTPPRHGQAVTDAIPSARVETLTGPGSSHALGLERAADFVPLVLGFLGQL